MIAFKVKLVYNLAIFINDSPSVGKLSMIIFYH